MTDQAALVITPAPTSHDDMDSNIHSPELFVQAYGQRDWRHYRWLVSVCVEQSEPGLIVDEARRAVRVGRRVEGDVRRR